MATRVQLSLFVPPPHDALLEAVLEAVRRTLDPVQAALIPAHVTLCREDELALVPERALLERLAKFPRGLRLRFGRAEPFSGHGVLLPGVEGEPAFAEVRRFLLGGTARAFAPHITLAHPRNPRAPGNHLSVALTLPPLIDVEFARVRRIEQIDSQPWRVLDTWPS